MININTNIHSEFLQLKAIHTLICQSAITGQLINSLRELLIAIANGLRLITAISRNIYRLRFIFANTQLLSLAHYLSHLHLNYQSQSERGYLIWNAFSIKNYSHVLAEPIHFQFV